MPDALNASPADDDGELMRRHGIALVRADQYHVDGYRYTNLADALAQAARRTAATDDGR